MNRYDEARRYIADRMGEDGHDLVLTKSKALKRLLRGVPLRVDGPPRDMTPYAVALKLGPSRMVTILATVDDHGDGTIEEHVSVGARHPLGFRVELPTWDELVAVRALAWDDDVEVHQVLPALTGPNAEPYINQHEVLHLRRVRA